MIKLIDSVSITIRNIMVLAFLLMCLSKENLSKASTWLGITVGLLNTFNTFTDTINFIAEKHIKIIDISLKGITCFIAFYLIFQGVPFMAKQYRIKKANKLD